MRKLNLAAACASCILCAILVAVAATGLQPGYTDVADAVATSDSSSVAGVSEGVFGQAGESEVADALEAALVAKGFEERSGSGGDGAEEDGAVERSAAERGVVDQEAAQVQKNQSAGGVSSGVPKAASDGASGKTSKAASGKNSGAASGSASGATGATGASSAKTAKTANTAPAQNQTNRRTITINGVSMDYVDSYGTSSAPSSDAGIWRGSDSTTDGSFGYFIGHNYTDFGAVANLETGSRVSVTDGDGNSRDYEVVDSFTVPRNTTWSEVSDRVTGYGESIAMQTCANGGYVIVVAK